MAPYYAPPDLHQALQQRYEITQKPRLSILFRRGQAPVGIFLVISGAVRLDFGVDISNTLNRVYGPGALLGLPATLTSRNYSMTATVTDDAELGFLSADSFKSLLREQPQLCRQLLDILSAQVSQIEDQARAEMLGKRKAPESELGLA
jgi:CRP-like cAMP-binding protein